MRIMLIYERAVTKFKGDLELWLRYAEFCRSQGSRRVQKVIFDVMKPTAWSEHYVRSVLFIIDFDCSGVVTLRSMVGIEC